MLLCRVYPGLDHLKNEKIILRHHAEIGHFAFEVGEAFLDQRWRDLSCGDGREFEFVEFVHPIAVTIANLHHLGGESHRGNCDHALACGLKRAEAVIALADHTGDLWRFELDHHMPGHGHYVGPSALHRRQEHDRPWLE